MIEARIGIVDLAMGNLRSVSNALHYLGFDSCWVEEPEGLDGLTHLIIPGVGSYDVAMRRMEERDLIGPIRAFAEAGRPLLGLCLGMQLLSTTGEEGEATSGLGLIPGSVERLRPAMVPMIPHVGWNSIRLEREHPLLDRIESGVDFYFVHSFHFIVRSPEFTLTTTEYGQLFVSGVARDNVVGFQFHPEKSQKNGLEILDNFCQWDGSC